MSRQSAKLLAIVGLVAAAALTALFVRLRFYSSIFLVISLLIGCGMYLFFTNRWKDANSSVRTPLGLGTRRRVQLLAATLFLLLSGLSLFLLPASLAFEKPFAYYLLVSAAGAMVALQIGILTGPRQIPGILGQIVFFALNVFGSNQVVFPDGIGSSDAPNHIHILAAPIAATGFLPTLNTCGYLYGDFPGHQLLVAFASVALGIDIASAYYLLGFVVMTIPVLVEFALIRHLFGPRIGLFAALLLSGSSYYIFWASHASALTFAIPVISVLLLLLVKLQRSTDMTFLLVTAILVVGLVVTHPYSSGIFGLILLGIVLGQRFIAARDRPNAFWIEAIASFFGYVLFFRWTYSCVAGEATNALSNLFGGSTGVATSSTFDVLPLWIILVNTAGDAILLTLAVAGFLLVVGSGLTARRMVVIGPTLLLLVFAFVGLITTIAYLLPNRVYVFLQFVGLAPLAAVGLRFLTLSRETKSLRTRPWAALAVVTVLVGAFVFASSTSTIAGFETSPFTGGRPFVKLYSTKYEIASSDWVCGYVGGPTPLRVSRSVSGLAIFELRDCLAQDRGKVHAIPFSADLQVDVASMKNQTYVMFSAFDFDPGFQQTIPSGGRFGQSPAIRLTDNSLVPLSAFNKVYDNGPMQIYYISR